jgi:betaine-aldehyde dehydrogenase
VLDVVTGYGPEAGEALTRHRDVAKLSFTGSTAVGKRVMQVASDRVVPVSLELGGKSPQIVFPDADEEWVVDGTIMGMRFFRQGQSCTAGSRLFVHADVLDSFVGKLTDRLSGLVVGDPLDEATDMGAIVSRKQFDRVCGYIADGIDQPGAVLALGGLPEPTGPLATGLYVEPTVFTHVSNDWRIAAEEIFGPVVCVIPWRDEAEVVRMANATHYGLAGFVWTKDLGAGLRTAHALEAGWVQVNQGGGQVLGQSYGGYKESGIGREFSLEGMLDAYTVRKHVSVALRH